MKKVIIFCLGIVLFASCKNSGNRHYPTVFAKSDNGASATGGPAVLSAGDSLVLLHHNIHLLEGVTDSVSTLITHISLEDYSDIDANTPSYLKKVDNLKAIQLKKRGGDARRLMPNAIHMLRVAMSTIDTSNTRLLSKLDDHEMFVLKFSDETLEQAKSYLKHP